jgi:hypothetical protein
MTALSLHAITSRAPYWGCRFCFMLQAQVQQQDDGLDEEIEGD